MFTRKSAADHMVTITIGFTLFVMSGFKTTDGKNVYVLLAFRSGVIGKYWGLDQRLLHINYSQASDFSRYI